MLALNQKSLIVRNKRTGNIIEDYEGHLRLSYLGVEKVAKIVKKAGTSSKNRELLQEYEILKKLDHANIQKIHDVHGDDKHYYLISEYSSS